MYREFSGVRGHTHYTYIPMWKFYKDSSRVFNKGLTLATLKWPPNTIDEMTHFRRQRKYFDRKIALVFISKGSV